MSNSRTVEKKVIWHLEMNELEDGCMTAMLEYVQEYSDFEATRQLCKKLLTLVPREGDDEKDSTVDDGLDLSFDDLCFKFDGPGPVSMGPPASGDNPGSGPTVPQHSRPKTDFHPTDLYGSTDPQGDVAHPGLDASSTDANLSRLTKLADVCSGGCKAPLAEDRDKFPPKRTWPFGDNHFG
jgi:hypothetical protein